MPRSGKPKFRVGQVVIQRSDCDLIVRIDEIRNGEYYVLPGNMERPMNRENWFAESELRPLTAHEIGPRQKRSRQSERRKGDVR
jgi:hypothetical protein